MPVQVLMPALSPTMEKGNLAKWIKKEGDRVKSGDVIAEIETDKATMEVEAVDEGTIGQILVPEGTADVAVNTPIAVILSEGEDKSAIKDGGGAGAQPAPQQKAAESAPPAEARKAEPEVARTPAEPKSAEPPKPATVPEPDVPEGTEMVTMTMREAGVTMVSLGIFSWSRIQPREGEFDFAWLDRVIDLLHEGGIAVDLATATASPPPWASAAYPELLPQDEDGATYWPGSRQHFA